jgi:pimeloyl-ACP methyl ester carboxylesterase
MTRDTKKKRVLVDRAFMKEIRTPFDETEKHYELCVKWMKQRTADLGFAIDTVKAAAASGARDESWFIPDGEGDDALRSVLRITDPVRLGLIGHSMGGAAAVAVGRQRGDVSAVIDLDGTMLGEYLGVENGKYLINSEPYPTPILEFSSWEAYTDNPAASRREVGGYPNDVLMRNAAAGFFTTIRDTKHMDFTDLPLFSPFLGKKLGKGERDTAEAMQIVNSLVLSFFDCYLKGEGVFTVQKIY